MSDVKFGKRDINRANKIISSGNNLNMVTIKYRDKKGNISSRTVEPYKLDGNDFWAFDRDKDSIRRFKLKNIQSLKSTNKKYEPRWDVEMNKIAMYEDEIYKMAFRDIRTVNLYGR